MVNRIVWVRAVGGNCGKIDEFFYRRRAKREIKNCLRTVNVPLPLCFLIAIHFANLPGRMNYHIRIFRPDKFLPGIIRCIGGNPRYLFIVFKKVRNRFFIKADYFSISSLLENWSASIAPIYPAAPVIKISCLKIILEKQLYIIFRCGTIRFLWFLALFSNQEQKTGS